jgi:hypothetical protein
VDSRRSSVSGFSLLNGAQPLLGILLVGYLFRVARGLSGLLLLNLRFADFFELSV